MKEVKSDCASNLIANCDRRKFPVKIYKVGGCVRDRLMGKNPHDYDYVVTGADDSYMKANGFMPSVGNHFPVYIEPFTKDEYALARKEIKIGNKHTDFRCMFSPDVTIEEDLKRRDFTINAIAEDDSGKLYYVEGALEDLKNKVLRHVSYESFQEDPLRVLRAFRFCSTHNLSIHSETAFAISQMVESDCLKDLTVERVWKEFEKALNSKNFYCFISQAYRFNALHYIMPELDIACSYMIKDNKSVSYLINSLMDIRYDEEILDDEISLVNWVILCRFIDKFCGQDGVEKTVNFLKVPNYYIKLAKFALVINQISYKDYNDVGFCYRKIKSATNNFSEYFDKFFRVCQIANRCIQSGCNSILVEFNNKNHNNKCLSILYDMYRYCKSEESKKDFSTDKDGVEYGLALDQFKIDNYIKFVNIT